MTAGLFVLDDVVKVGASGQHGCLTQAISTQNHEQTQKAHPLQLLQLWGRRYCTLNTGIHTLQQPGHKITSLVRQDWTHYWNMLFQEPCTASGAKNFCFLFWLRKSSGSMILLVAYSLCREITSLELSPSSGAVDSSCWHLGISSSTRDLGRILVVKQLRFIVNICGGFWFTKPVDMCN